MRDKKWVITAIEAQRRLDAGDSDRFDRQSDRGSPKRGRLARIHDIARDMGISGPTLRNYLIALAGLRGLSDMRAAALLEQHSAVAVATFARWARRAPHSAYDFIYRNPQASLNQLLSAERADRARSHGRAGRRPRPELDDALIARICAGPQFSAALGPNEAVQLGPGAQRWEIIPARYKFAGLDELIVPDGGVDPDAMGQTALAGIIRLPLLSVLDDYGRRSREVWWRATSASVHCPLVLVVFPGPAARRRFLAALPEASEGENFAGLVQAPRAGTGSALRSLYFRSAPGLGLIVMTSPLTLLRDLAA